jgi:peptidyl-Lys metalloendopeptidase
MATFKAKLRSDKSYRVGEEVRLRFEFTNSTREALYVLTWYTPLEGLYSDCLTVTRDGKRVRYDGLKVARGKPSERSYMRVAAGQTISAEVLLNEAYNVSRPGEYRVTLNTSVRNLVAASSTSELKAKLASLQEQAREKLPATWTSFIVLPTRAKPLKTIGRRVRGEQKAAAKRDKSKKAKGGVKALALKDPKFLGGNATQQAKAKKSHEDGFKLCVDALSTLANNNDYKVWFGVHTASRFAKVKDCYTKVSARMQSTVFTYDLSGTGCKPDWLAYTTDGSTTIWYCSGFWGLPATGPDSMAGTNLHEHTHSDAFTNDHAPDQASCRALAKTDPDKAVDNANNYEYHAKG